MLDADLAELYGVTPKRLNEQVRRNQERFPEDFVFQLEFNGLGKNRSQIATSSRKYRGPKRAVKMSVYVVRAFVKLRQVLASSADLARKLATLEKSVAALDAGTRKQFEEVCRAIRALMMPPATKSRPI